MNDEGPLQIYICSNCMLPGDGPGRCPRCGRERIGCRPGSDDDPCRRPWIDSEGRVRTRAPMWWLQYTVRALAETLGRVD